MTGDGMCGVFIPDRVLAGCWKSQWKSHTQACLLVQICGWHIHHLATWTRKTNGFPKPPQWDSQQNTIHHGNRSRSPPISGYQHIQEGGLLTWTQSLSETHPHKPLPTPKIPSPSSQQTLSRLVPGTQSENSMRSGIPCTGINIPHHCLQTKWLQPSADTMSHKIGHTDQQDKINLRLQPTYRTPKLHTADSEC